VSAAALELRQLSRIYGQGASEVRALDRVDLRIEPGELVAIMGASGSGKSTCMNILGCLDAPTSGTYSCLGVDVTGLDQDQRARLRRTYFGFVFQSFNLLARTPARENVELPLIYRKVSARERRTRALEALRLVGLEDRAMHTPAELSGGQQQRVAIARALVTDPALLFADEPTGNLDSARSDEIMELFMSLNRTRGLTIVLVTHDANIAEQTQRVITFKDGRIVADQRRSERH
jgi:putative ABC transport system ATP-binding protein